MKIALIFPPSLLQTKETMPPLGLAWLAAVLRQGGFNEVYIIDSVIYKYSNQEIVDILKERGADIIGLSFGTQNRFYAFELARLIKENFPPIPIVAGGPHPTLTTDDILKNIKSIDMVVRGEGEKTFLDLIKKISQKQDLKSVNGLSYRDERGSIINNPGRAPIVDLDNLPLPARDLLPIEKYRQKIPLSDKICTSMITSRGCPYNCIYCSTAEQWGHNIRFRSPKNVVDEIELLVDQYGFEGVGFFDDCFTIDKNRVIEICQEIIKRKLKVAWWCEARANTIDEEIVYWMKAAGCEHIAMAIESGSDEVLKRIRKAITKEMAIEACKIIKRSGIKLKCFFMLGLPGETYREIKETVFLSRYLLDEVGVDEATQGVTIIYPQTQIESLAKQLKILPNDFSWSDPYQELRTYPPLYISQSMPIFEQANLNYEQIYNYTKRAKIEYYLRHPLISLRQLSKNYHNIKKWLTTNPNN